MRTSTACAEAFEGGTADEYRLTPAVLATYGPSTMAATLVRDPVLDRLSYRCPEGCPPGRSCCVGLVVEVSRREVRAIDSLMDELAALVPALRDGEEYANVFVDDPPDVVIEGRADGSCPFLYRTRRHTLCSIHSVALATGRAVPAVKPAACRHWPLMLEVHRGRVRVTIQPAAERIGCVAPRAQLPDHPTVAEAFAAELAELDRAAQCVAAPAARRTRSRRRNRAK
jgi:Fe-S-cluster containining protein